MIIDVSLFISLTALIGGVFVFAWRAHHLAEIPLSHVVGFESGRYYCKLTGPWDNRTTITRRQYDTYHQNMRISNVFLFAGLGLLFPAVIFVGLQVRQGAGKKLEVQDDLA